MVAALANPIAETWTEPDGSGVTLFSEGDALFDAMLSDIASARERVWLESYIFADDAIGRVFVERLAECAARGVEVRNIISPQVAELAQLTPFARVDAGRLTYPPGSDSR